MLYARENFFRNSSSFPQTKLKLPIRNIFYNFTKKHVTMIECDSHIYLKSTHVLTLIRYGGKLFNFLPRSSGSCRVKLFFRGRRFPILERDFKLMIVFQYRDISFSQDTNAFYCPHIDKIFFCVTAEPSL